MADIFDTLDTNQKTDIFDEISSKKPMFSSEAEGRKSTQQAEKEQKAASFMSNGIMPYVDAIDKTMKQGTQAGGVMANTALMGVPGIVSELSTGGHLVNPLKQGFKDGRLLTEGGTNVFEGKDLSDGQKFGAEAIGSLLPTGGVLKALGIDKSLGNIAKYSKSENRINLADSVRNGIINAKKNLTDIFGGEYEKIIGESDKKINIGNSIKTWLEDHGAQITQNEQFSKALANKDPQATKLYNMVNEFSKNGDKVEQQVVSAQEADKFQKFIKNLPGLKGKIEKGYKGYADMTNSDRIMLDLANNIKSDVIEAHPDLMSLNQHYGDQINKIKLLRKGLGSNSQMIENMRNFHKIGEYEDRAANDILDKNTLNRIKEFNSADRTAKLLKTFGLWSAGTIGAGAGFEGARHGISTLINH